MYIQWNKVKAKNNKVYSSVLLCRKYRDSGKIKTEVIANLSKFPMELVLTIENVLKNAQGALVAIKDVIVRKSIDYGLIMLLVHLMDKLRISQTLEKVLPAEAPLLKTMIIGKIVTRGSKLGICNWIKRYPQIAAKLGVDAATVKPDDFYKALASVDSFQEKLYKKWFLYNNGKHKEIYLYDITSTYFEGTQNELSAFGYNRDGKKGKMQINIGLVTDSQGFPLKIEVFEGNVSDQKTVLGQITQLKETFDTQNIIFVGDRGMKIRYNLQQLEETQKSGIEYITGLTHSEIETLIEDNVIQLGLFSKTLAEVEHNGIRYILSINPDLQSEGLTYLKRQKTLADKKLTEIKGSWEKRALQHSKNIEKLNNGHKNKKLVTSFSAKQIDKYKLRVSEVFTKYHVKRYYQIKEINYTEFSIDFNEQEYQSAKNLAGKYVICSNVQPSKMDKETVRGQYKNLQNVEHAFRDLKSDNIQLRPVFHRKAEQTRGHVLVSMFSYAIIKEMENRIFPFRKVLNKEQKKQLSFSDLLAELQDIKLCVLNFGRGVEQIKVTELNDMQVQLIKLFDMTKADIDKTL
jgi:transposase